ncbi:SMP-30/gluconolactonase/LRE family protein [Nocardia asteroides]|uniref:SMP-30/gluconolactonase/LRE family protein n=1 Tax=Nocardia asteroides TaxID=1824 RepID=UPI001E3A7F7F|nr:SMP-30/gluconolactonase/LRE family protein [Nocardia asteroides]UGT65181.1 SMP-30/gluconolactonase/LRE family protein [Nocardia asteroides]
MFTILIGALLGVAVVGCGSNSSDSAPTDSCAPSGGLTFICDVANPEDVVLVPNSEWALASGMKPGSGLHLIDTRGKTVSNLYMADAPKAEADQTKYAGCPGPLDPAEADLHGLSLRQTDSGRYTVYAINHGGRESVEVFDLDARGPAPSATWTGCVLMPNGLQGNGVAAFNDGTILATVPQMPGTTFDDVLAGETTGAVYMWTPGSAGFQALPGTELAGNNGIETSPDDSKFYVVSVGERRIVEFARDNPGTPLRSVQLAGFVPDNLHWTADNRLITAGMLDAEPSCAGTLLECSRGYKVDTIDPTTMAVTELASGPATPDFPGTASAVQVGGELWLGSFYADRLAYRSLSGS